MSTGAQDCLNSPISPLFYLRPADRQKDVHSQIPVASPLLPRQSAAKQFGVGLAAAADDNCLCTSQSQGHRTPPKTKWTGKPVTLLNCNINLMQAADPPLHTRARVCVCRHATRVYTPDVITCCMETDRGGFTLGATSLPIPVDSGQQDTLVLWYFRNVSALPGIRAWERSGRQARIFLGSH